MLPSAPACECAAPLLPALATSALPAAPLAPVLPAVAPPAGDESPACPLGDELPPQPVINAISSTHLYFIYGPLASPKKHDATGRLNLSEGAAHTRTHVTSFDCKWRLSALGANEMACTDPHALLLRACRHWLHSRAIPNTEPASRHSFAVHARVSQLRLRRMDSIFSNRTQEYDSYSGDIV